MDSPIHQRLIVFSILTILMCVLIIIKWAKLLLNEFAKLELCQSLRNRCVIRVNLFFHKFHPFVNFNTYTMYKQNKLNCNKQVVLLLLWKKVWHLYGNASLVVPSTIFLFCLRKLFALYIESFFSLKVCTFKKKISEKVKRYSVSKV